MKQKLRIIISLTLTLFGIVFGTGLLPVGNSVQAAMEDMAPQPPVTSAGLATATFAGGCFWCMERPFEALYGVREVISGYTGGHKLNPTYHEVSSGTTGHVEAVQVTYDPKIISYDKLLDVYWHQIDPTDAGGSFVDRGSQYRSVIFYHDATQQKQAVASRNALDQRGIYGKPIATELLPAGAFYPAEDYHQNYYKVNPVRYHFYRSRSGRDQFLAKIWGAEPATANHDEESTVATDQQSQFVKPSAADLRQRLTALQYQVTQEEGTERPFNNEFWDNKRPGIYVDIVSGEPLFSSTDKFDSGTGWPSFTKPITLDGVSERQDRRLFSVRTEVRSKLADSHLGHVFEDGPAPTGKRYCINSAALRFIPAENLTVKGYAQYAALFN